jgi:hypothetical protein
LENIFRSSEEIKYPDWSPLKGKMLKNTKSFEALGESFVGRARTNDPMPMAFTHGDLTLPHSMHAMDQVGEESGEEENFQEENMEEVQEVELLEPLEGIKTKGTTQFDIEEGETIIEKTRKSGRHTNKDVREDTANKEKVLGKQHSIERSLNNEGKRGGSRGAYLLIPTRQASSNHRQ